MTVEDKLMHPASSFCSLQQEFIQLNKVHKTQSYTGINKALEDARGANHHKESSNVDSGSDVIVDRNTVKSSGTMSCVVKDDSSSATIKGFKTSTRSMKIQSQTDGHERLKCRNKVKAPVVKSVRSESKLNEFRNTDNVACPCRSSTLSDLRNKSMAENITDNASPALHRDRDKRFRTISDCVAEAIIIRNSCEQVECRRGSQVREHTATDKDNDNESVVGNEMNERRHLGCLLADDLIRVSDGRFAEDLTLENRESNMNRISNPREAPVFIRYCRISFVLSFLFLSLSLYVFCFQR